MLLDKIDSFLQIPCLQSICIYKYRPSMNLLTQIIDEKDQGKEKSVKYNILILHL